MHFIVRSNWVALGALLMLSAVPTKGHAIPYFARKYKTTCARCHVGFPKLNTFGRNFQLHGYQQPGEKNVGTVPTPEDKNLSLLDQIPIGIFVENRLELDKAGGNDNKPPSNIGSPSAYHLLAAGTLAPDIGFFTELGTDDTSSDNAATTGKMVLTFNHLGNQNVHLQVGKLDLMEHGVTEHNLFTRAGFALHDQVIGETTFNVGTENRGIRLYGMMGSPLTPAFFHGKPEAPAKEDKDDKEDSKGDKGDSKPSGDGGPHATKIQKGGEGEEVDPMDQFRGTLWELGVYQGTDGPATHDNKDVGGRFNVYFNNDSFAGIFGYSGQNDVFGDPTIVDKHRFVGADFSVQLGKPFEKSPGVMQKPFEIFGSYMSGSNDNPLGDGNKVNWNGYFVEGDYVMDYHRIALLRYDKINSTDMPGLEQNLLTANYSYYLRTNFVIGVEYTHDLTSAHNHMLGVIFNFGF